MSDVAASGILKGITPITRTRSYEQLTEQIEALIRSDQLRPGDKMPSERQLATQFEVSRVVVREATRNLEARGIIEVRQGSGAYVKAAPPRTMAQSLTLLLQLEKASVLDLWSCAKRWSRTRRVSPRPAPRL